MPSNAQSCCVAGTALRKEDLPDILFQQDVARNGTPSEHSTLEQIEQEHIRRVLRTSADA